MVERVTAFLGDERIASGDRSEVTRLIEQRYPGADHQSIFAFDDETGRLTDLEFWNAAAGPIASPAAPRSPGRPKLGVVAREVTLLPRHWEWLARQPGGASATLRRLVENACRSSPDPRERRDAVYHFLSATSGNRPGYEAALRALYQGDDTGFCDLISDWPADVRDYAESLLGNGCDS
jgi:hypothetical protein